MSHLTTKIPTWDDARYLLNQFKGHAVMTVCAKVCLGLTLRALKEKEGYIQGRHTADCGMSWPDLLQQELGISADTATRFILAGDAVKAKIKTIGGQPRLLTLLETPVHTLSKTDADHLQAAIRTATDGESITSLLREFKIIKVPPPPPPDPGAGGRAERTKPSEEQLAWDFAGGTVISQLSHIRSGPQFTAALHTLPLSSTDTIPFGLIDFVAELKAAYEAAEAALKSRMKS